MKEEIFIVATVFVVLLVGLFFSLNNNEPHILVAPHGITGAQVISYSTFLPSAVTLLSISPDNVSQASVLEYTLTGAEFNSSAVVSTSNPDVSVLSAIIVNDTTILVNMSVAANASTGVYDVVVTQDTESSTLSGGLEIYEGPFDPATLINVSSGYFEFNHTTNTTLPVNLTYTITTAPGVDKGIVNVTGGYLEVTDEDTNTSTIINLTSAVDPEGTFTLTFDETTFYQEGDYEVEMYLDLIVDGETVEREYYGPYFGVGSPTCNLVPPCIFNGVVGSSSNIQVNIIIATLPITICQLGTPPLGCATVPGPGAACTITCNSPVAGVFNSNLIAADSSSFCVPFPPVGIPCTFTFTLPPPPPSGGGSHGGTNSYTGNVICPAYCKEARYQKSVAICSSPACQAITNINAGPPPGVTYSGPSPKKTPEPTNVPVIFSVPPESRVPEEHRTVPQEQLPVTVKPFKLPPGMREQLQEHPPTVPIEQLQKYRTLQTEKTMTQRITDSFVNFYYFIESLIAPAPETQMPTRLYRRDEGYTELTGDIMILKAAVHPLPPVIGPSMNTETQIAVGPDDILVVVNK